MQHFDHNIKVLRKRNGMTQSALAERLDVNRGRLAKYEEGRSEPPFSILGRIARTFDVSVDDLLNKDLNEAPDKPDQGPPEREVLPVTVSERDGRDLIEVVPEEATAGYLSGYGDPEYIESLRRMKLPFLPTGKHRAFPVRGDSMWPVPDGAYIVGRYIEHLDRIRDGRTYIVVSRTDGITYKRVWNEAHKNGTLLLVPDNKRYQTYRVDAGSVVELWEYVCNINTREYDPEELNHESIMQMLRSMNITLTDMHSWMKEMRDADSEKPRKG